MITKKVLNPNRLRRIDGGFSFIPHRFLTEGFLASLSQKESLLYFLLILASDRHGLSFYAYDEICSLLECSVDEYIEARDGLIEKDLIAFDGTLFQVLSLPPQPTWSSTVHPLSHSEQGKNRSKMRQLIQRSLFEAQDGQ